MDSLTLPETRAKPLLPTPFFARQRDFCITDQFIPWSGYSTVDVFTTVEQEYFAIRNSCSVYDLTPMIKYRITGRDAESYLNRLVTRDVSKLKTDRVAYAVWCNDTGHVIDDGTIFRFGAEDFMLCTAERQLNWLLDSAIGFSVRIEEVTEQIAALSVQGPTSCGILRKAGFVGVERVKPFEIGRFTAFGAQISVSRTGFTGDLGYELWMAPADAERVWDGLMAAGQSRGIRPIGSAALNLARIEAGFLMPNVDFISAEKTVHLDRERTPYELGLEWAVDLRKTHFNGRRALAKQAAVGPRRKLVGLDVAGQKPAESALLYATKSCRKKVGSVSSGVWSPTAKRNIALAMLDMPYFTLGSEVWAEIYLCRELVWERRIAKAVVVAKPFFQPERRRLTPPADR
jgi:aminomethyltransferase